MIIGGELVKDWRGLPGDYVWLPRSAEDIAIFGPGTLIHVRLTRVNKGHGEHVMLSLDGKDERDVCWLACPIVDADESRILVRL